MTLRLRREAASDIDVVRDVIDAAFRGAPTTGTDRGSAAEEDAADHRGADQHGANEHGVDEHGVGQQGVGRHDVGRDDGHRHSAQPQLGDGQRGAQQHGGGQQEDDPVGADQLAVEAGLADALRADPGFETRLTFVAEVDGVVVGQLMASRGALVSPHGAPDLPVVGLGPLAVDPQFQGRGIGSALLHAVVGAAESLDEPAVVVLGDPGFYARFGFETSAAVGILAPDDGWGDAFQVRTLSAYVPTMVGRYRYAAPFDDL